MTKGTSAITLVESSVMALEGGWAAALGSRQPSNEARDPPQPLNGRIVPLNKGIIQHNGKYTLARDFDFD